MDNKVNIVIVGAGVAGLAAANHIVNLNKYLTPENKRTFKILEGRSRIGGRIVSIPLSKENVELGANWIHGVLGNPIFELAVKFGLVSVVNVPKPHKVIATTETGQQCPMTSLQEIYEAYVCFLRRCDEYFLCQFSPPPDINSVGEHIQYEIELYLNSIDDATEKHIRRLIFNCLLKRETCITGCHSMNDIDLLELGSYTELQGGNIIPPSGYSSILKPLIDELPQDSVILKCPVKRINWKRKSIGGLETVDENSENESDDSDKTVIDFGAADADNEYSVRVSCEDGQTFLADHVICTVPLGVLKNSSLFDPKLPHYKQESIDRMMFGTVDKIILEYDRPILLSEITEVMLLWDDQGVDLLTEEERNSAEYFSKNWFKKIYSFAKISEMVLLGWISGKEAEYMETLSHEDVAGKCTEILRKFLNDPYIPKPVKCVW